MKIWIDLTNSPHVNFFADMIRELEREHEVLLTCRPLANTIELLELNGFPFHVVGRHYGQHTANKMIGFGIRILQLYRFLRGRGIQAAISHSSFYSPVVSRMLGIPSLYLNDNEHASGNRISFLCASRIMVPEFLQPEKVRRQWAKPEKIITYPGVKEGVYLWCYKPEQSGSFSLERTAGRQTVFIRPEPWTAQYYRGSRNFIDDLLLELKESFTIVLLPRGSTQEAHYRQAKFSGIHIPEKSIGIADIMENCDLFIGAGGTMTREAAVLGVPTISIYQDTLLDVDTFLIRLGCLVHNAHPDAAFVKNFLYSKRRQTPDKQLLHKGHEAYGLIRDTLLGLAP